jgi:copper oxidase (laccase) domain-containing protein
MSTYSYNVQGQSYPQDTVAVSTTAIGRSFEETQKAFARYGEDYAHPSVTSALFAHAEGAGIIGVDLRRFNDHSLKMTGLNTAQGGSPSTLEINYGTAAVAGNMTTFAICEAVWSMGPDGRMSVSM